MTAKKIKKTCPVCGESFLGSPQAMFCSKKCSNRHHSAQRRENISVISANNEIRYNALLKYVEENNLKSILKKYKNLFRKVA
jgi:predicted nucleic acid-binding Zn ribbon protein